MISRGHRVYRGSQSAGSRLPAVLLFIFVFLLLAALMAFSLLPEYLVYHRDKVEMVVPMLEESGQPYTITAVAGPGPYGSPVNSSIQVAAPDYSVVDMAETRSLGYLQAYYIPMSKVTETSLDGAVKEAQRSISAMGAKGLVLEMKDESGKLAWMSNVARASSIASNSNWDPSAMISELKADGWYLAAKVCCGVDTQLAVKDETTALRDPNGAVFYDATGMFVDLWNRDVRNYIIDLCTDLIGMGFDEIILARVEHPNSTVIYTRDIAATLDRQACVMNFSIAVRRGLTNIMAKNGTHLDAYADHIVLGADTVNGQTLSNLLKVFDRVVISTGTYGQDAPVFTEAKIDSTLRFVPQMTWGFGGGSWIIDPNAPPPA